MNTLMKECIRELDVPAYLRRARLSRRLQPLVDGGIREVDGCFFLGAVVTKPFDVQAALTESVDRTALWR